MVDTDAADQHLPEFRTDSLCEVLLADTRFNLTPNGRVDQTGALQALRDFPA